MRSGLTHGSRSKLVVSIALLGSALCASAGADPQPSLPMRPGVYVPIGIGVDRPCAKTQLDIAVTWDGHQLRGLGREIVDVKLLKRAVLLPGYSQPGPRYLVHTRVPGVDGIESETWTFAGTDIVVVKADPILWCARSLGELKRQRGEVP